MADQQEPPFEEQGQAAEDEQQEAIANSSTQGVAQEANELTNVQLAEPTDAVQPTTAATGQDEQSADSAEDGHAAMPDGSQETINDAERPETGATNTTVNDDVQQTIAADAGDGNVSQTNNESPETLDEPALNLEHQGGEVIGQAGVVEAGKDLPTDIMPDIAAEGETTGGNDLPAQMEDAPAATSEGTETEIAQPHPPAEGKSGNSRPTSAGLASKDAPIASELPAEAQAVAEHTPGPEAVVSEAAQPAGLPAQTGSRPTSARPSSARPGSARFAPVQQPPQLESAELQAAAAAADSNANADATVAPVEASQVTSEATKQAGSRPASASSTAAAVSVPPLQMTSVQPASGPVSTPRSRSASSRSGRHKPPTTLYDPVQFAQAVDATSQLPADVAPTVHLISLDAQRRNNMAYIEDDVLVTAAGNRVVFLHLSTMTQTYLCGLDGGSIGAVAVHPTRRYLAVAEKCRHRAPNIYVYTYPGLALYKVMQGGTEQAYSALSFNESGDQLCSVGSYPDYLITLWQWEQEAIVLRSKAFSQEVYTVKFSNYFPGNMTTCGTGHIRFWKMASTFTGLKLQGQIGKFGAVELSDVLAFVELPDGKVVSGSETGELLVWDGGLIKVVLTRTNKRPCHNGQIYVLLHDRGSNTILSAGADGYVRLWDFNKINEAEPDEDSHSLGISPVDEVLVSPNTAIQSLIWERRHWLILDDTGTLMRVDLPQAGLPSKGATTTRLLEFHAGGIEGLIMSPTAHIVMTASRDGSVKAYDYAARKQLASVAFGQPATCMAALGKSGTLAAVGFKDGVLRVVARVEGSELKLLSACKPHKGAVTAISVTADGKHLVTCGQDSRLFFFSFNKVSLQLEPVCFIKVPATPLCASWAPDSTTLLVGLANSKILEVTAPNKDQIDTHKTYEVDLPASEYTFRLPKPRKTIKRRIPKAPKEGGAVKEDATEQQTGSTDAGVGQQEGGDSNSQQPPAVEYEEEEVVIIDEEAAEAQELQEFEVLTVCYEPGVTEATNHILVTLTGKAVGSVWKCDLQDPNAEPVIHCSTPASAPTSCVTYSSCGKLQLLGTVDGIVRVQPLSAPYKDAHGPYWQAPLHDVQRGRVTSVGVSFDNAYLLTAAKDGTIYLQSLHLQGFSPASPQDSGHENLQPLHTVPAHVTDITNPQEYTLEEAKQKAEQDALEAAAEAKKLGVREHLAQIRAEFEALMEENEAKPEGERLPRSAFEIDVGLREMVEQETAKQEEAARSELAWETEKHRLALQKLKAFFLENVEVERTVLHALNSKQYVTSFRTAKMSAEMVEELSQAKQAEVEWLAAMEKRKAPSAADTTNTLQGTTQQVGGTSRNKNTTDSLNDTSRSKAEFRRAARKQREADWAAFNTTRPDDKYEDPADVAAIEEAERNMGDYKLKSDPAYVVPEEARMTPQRKRYHMLLLAEAMHKARMEFNQRFLALREVKKKVLSEVNSRITQLQTIDAHLGGSGEGGEGQQQPPLTPLSMQPEEMPEERETVTDSDIEEFLRKKEEDERKAAEGSALGGFATGSTAKPATDSNTTASSAAQRGAAAVKPPVGLSGQGKGGLQGGRTTPTPPAEPAPVSHQHASATSPDDALSRIMAAVPLTDLERQLQTWHRRRLSQQRSRLRVEINEMCDAFDAALTTLRRDKFRVEKELKMCELRQLVHSQELTLLLDFDKREVVLIKKRAARMDDRNDLMDKISECSNKLETKRLELEALMARRAAVSAEFDSVVPESDPFREPLAKVFFRRIKRNKKKAGAGDGDNEESDSDEDDEDEGDDDDDDDDVGQDVCPTGCDQGLYEKVCDLRERRLDEEEQVADFSKAIEALRKDREGLAKKQKLLEQGLVAVNAEIAAFQQEKQAALNQIDVVVHLHLHQVEYLIDGRIPDDLSAALVFSSTQLDRLRKRIDELEEEKGALRHRHKTLKKEHQQLLKDKADKEARVAELEARAHDVQMLKFGQEVDLELLDALGVSTGTEELRAELARQEASHARELSEWDAKIAARTNELMALTRENTEALNAVTTLTSAQRKVESGLTVTRKTMFTDPVTQRRKEVEERDHLVQLVNAQAKELERLRTQVQALRRKDTSVYS